MYVNGLVRAGFALKRIEEPRPTEEVAVENPWIAPWRIHAAIFIYFHAEKPVSLGGPTA
jgi:hypothetical protein